MKKSSLTIFFLFLFYGTTPAQNVEVGDADTVIIDTNDGGILILGAIEHSLGGGGGFTGRLSRTQPAGPVIVYIFRDISEKNKQHMNNAGIKAKENSAYLLPESEGYSVEGMQKMQFISEIDPDLSDKELASLFGVSAPSEN